MKEKILEMLKMQEALDKSFMEYMGRTKPLTVDEVLKALFDELGEVNHEMKSEWCYWKKSQKPVDRDEVKKELADVLHFSLTLHRISEGFNFDEEQFQHSRNLRKKLDWFSVIACMPLRWDWALYDFIILTEKLGFTFEEMYQAYIDKNKVNYQRIKEGY